MQLAKVTLLLAGLGIAVQPPPGDGACTCAQARLKHQWCAACKVGYVAGVRIESALLYEEIDAHGHDIDPAKIECPSCQKALAQDGYCEKCRMGFVRRQAYLSRLTYFVAKGETRDPATISCKTCRKNAESHGWCDECAVGMVGNVALKRREDFEPAARAYDVLRAAVSTLKRCETCAVAMILDGRCPTCRISYRDGAKVEEKP